MKVGRKPKHEFNSLEIGQKSLLKGKAKKFPYQFINQYNKTNTGVLKIVRDEEGKFYAERIA
jgi:hypothetical protein